MLSELAAGRLGDQQQGVGLALQRQRPLALEAAGDDDPRRRDVGGEQLAPRPRSAARRPPAPAAPRRLGSSRGELGEAPRPAAAGRARSCRSARCRRARRARGRAARRAGRVRGAEQLGVPAVADQQRVGDAAPRAGPSAAGSETQTTASAGRRASGAPAARRAGAGRAVGNGGRSGSKVQASRTSATQATPRRCSASPTACADSGGEVVITQSNGACAVERAGARERANGTQASASGSGTTQLAERMRPARVGVGVEQRVDAVGAAQPRAPELRVGRPLDDVESSSSGSAP